MRTSNFQGTERRNGTYYVYSAHSTEREANEALDKYVDQDKNSTYDVEPVLNGEKFDPPVC